MKAKQQSERRAKAARRSSRLICPRPPLRDFTKRIWLKQNLKKPNPLMDELTRGFGVSADSFGASPVASALDLRFGRDPDADPSQSNMSLLPPPSKPELSTLHRIGTFYFALTSSTLLCRRKVRSSYLCKVESSS